MSLQHESHEFIADNIFAGTQVQPVVADEVLLATGQGILTRGTAIGKKDNGEYVVVALDVPEDDPDPAVPGVAINAILAETTDTGDDADQTAIPAPGYFTGEFNERAITFGEGETADDYRDAARAKGIFFKDTVPA